MRLVGRAALIEVQNALSPVCGIHAHFTALHFCRIRVFSSNRCARLHSQFSEPEDLSAVSCTPKALAECPRGVM